MSFQKPSHPSFGQRRSSTASSRSNRSRLYSPAGSLQSHSRSASILSSRAVSSPPNPRAVGLPTGRQQSTRASEFLTRVEQRSSTPRSANIAPQLRSSRRRVSENPQTRLRHAHIASSSPQEHPGPVVQTNDSQTLASEIDPDADALSEVVMAVDVRDRGTVGCCYYVARDEKLYFMEDMKLGGVDVVDACEWMKCPISSVLTRVSVKLFIEPTVILVPGRADDAVMERLDPEARTRGSRYDQSVSTVRNLDSARLS